MKANQVLAVIPFAASLVAALPFERKSSELLNGRTVAAWWGQDTHDLSDLCSDSSFDIIMLSFLTQLTPPGLNLAGHAGGPSAAQTAMGWDKLIDGTVEPDSKTPSIASQIKTCQEKNRKKIMVSFGGDARVSDATFSSDADATESANQLWNLLLGGTNTTSVPADVRPFGKVVLDGVDLDNETGQSTYYNTFVAELRTLMKTDKDKKYFMSATPQLTDFASTTASIPDSLYPSLDFVNVQFYNNPQDPGELGHPDFLTRVGQWNDKFKALSPSTKLMVAAPVSTLAATGQDVGVRSAADITSDIKGIKAAKLSNFGGFALWAGGWAIDNGNWQKAVKTALKA